MRKKLLSLMTLLLCAVTGAWADGDLFSAVCTASSNVSFPKSATTEITSNATISGGKMYAVNGQSSAKNLMTSSGFCMTNNNTYFKIELNTALAAGDEICITFTGGLKDSSPKGIKVSTEDNPSGTPVNYQSATKSEANDGTFEYYVEADDNFKGKTTFYVYRAVGSTQYFNNVKVTSAASIVKHSVTYALGEGTGTLPTQADVKEGGTFTVADAPDDLTAPTGKEFKCWNDGTDDYDEGATYTMGTSNVTLTAVYQTISVKYAITYDLGSGTGTAPTQESLAAGATFTVASAPDDLVPPTGKEFKCWNDGTADYDAGATYTMTATAVTLTAVYQDRTYKGLTPTATLDLSDATDDTFTTTWYTSNNMIKNSKYDALNGVVTFSPYAIYQASSSQTWAKAVEGNSTDNTWDATGVFQGNTFYFSTGGKAATARNTSRFYYYRITNCTSVSALVGGKAIIEAYEVSAGVVTADPVKDNSIDSEGTLSLTGLDKDKEYIIKVYGNNGNSNVVYKEIAFYFPAVTSVTITPSKDKTTYVTTQPLDFSGVDGLTAYVATGSTSSAVTLTSVDKVPAGTPLVLKGTASTPYDVPTTAEAETPATNYLVAGTGAAISAGDAAHTRYVLSGGVFKKINATPATVPVGKAYLEIDESGLGGGSPQLDLNFDGENGDDITTGIDTIEHSTLNIEHSEVYNLNGQRVSQPTKGLYIVNGKKVIVK